MSFPHDFLREPFSIFLEKLSLKVVGGLGPSSPPACAARRPPFPSPLSPSSPPPLDLFSPPPGSACPLGRAPGSPPSISLPPGLQGRGADGGRDHGSDSRAGPPPGRRNGARRGPAQAATMEIFLAAPWSVHGVSVITCPRPRPAAPAGPLGSETLIPKLPSEVLPAQGTPL
jgi:hypothetical protein